MPRDGCEVGVSGFSGFCSFCGVSEARCREGVVLEASKDRFSRPCVQYSELVSLRLPSQGAHLRGHVALGHALEELGRGVAGVEVGDEAGERGGREGHAVHDARLGQGRL